MFVSRQLQDTISRVISLLCKGGRGRRAGRRGRHTDSFFGCSSVDSDSTNVRWGVVTVLVLGSYVYLAHAQHNSRLVDCWRMAYRTLLCDKNSILQLYT